MSTAEWKDLFLMHESRLQQLFDKWEGENEVEYQPVILLFSMDATSGPNTSWKNVTQIWAHPCLFNEGINQYVIVLFCVVYDCSVLFCGTVLILQAGIWHWVASMMALRRADA